MLIRRNPPESQRVLAWLLVAVALITAGCAPTTVVSGSSSARLFPAQAIRYGLVTRQAPRPLRIHKLTIDLTNPAIELATALAIDPDGAGPATAQLTPPATLAQQTHALVLVNANPWQDLPDAAGKRSTNWHEGMPVEVLGLAATGGVVRHPPADPAHASFWIDAQGKPHLSCPANLRDVREGLAGFLQLVQAGRVLPVPGGPIHPRTALGLEATGRYLYLVVVDGRQPGYSEGMSTCELATYMLELGCRDALNLDGGGSTILLMSNPDGSYRTVNDPSTKQAGVSVARPIPAALVVRFRSAGSDSH